MYNYTFHLKMGCTLYKRKELGKEHNLLASGKIRILLLAPMEILAPPRPR